MVAMKKTSTKTSQTSADDRPIAYINVGKVEKSENDKQFMLSPFFGLAITEAPNKKGLSKRERALFEAIYNKAKALADAGNYGRHSINLDIELTVLEPESDETTSEDFDL